MSLITLLQYYYGAVELSIDNAVLYEDSSIVYYEDSSIVYYEI